MRLVRADGQPAAVVARCRSAWGGHGRKPARAIASGCRRCGSAVARTLEDTLQAMPQLDATHEPSTSMAAGAQGPWPATIELHAPWPSATSPEHSQPMFSIYRRTSVDETSAFFGILGGVSARASGWRKPAPSLRHRLRIGRTNGRVAAHLGLCGTVDWRDVRNGSGRGLEALMVRRHSSGRSVSCVTF